MKAANRDAKPGGGKKKLLGMGNTKVHPAQRQGPEAVGGALVDKGSRDGASISSIQEDNDEEADRDSE